MASHDRRSTHKESNNLVYLKYIASFLLLLSFVAGQKTHANNLDDLTIYTENYAPFNYEENGKIKGVNVELLMEIFKRAHIQKSENDIILTSWARGYKETQRRKNTLLFTMARTPQRENLFKWVGPISPSHMSLIARADAAVDLNNNNFNTYTYASMKDVRGEQALLAAGTDINNILHVNSSQSAAHLLARGRVDAWAYDRIVSFWVLHTLGYDPHDFEVVHTFSKSLLYFAFHPKTDDQLINRMQAALDAIQQDGTYASIQKKYTGAFNPNIQIEMAR